jgi:hypothetical protein
VTDALPMAAHLDVIWMGHPPARIDLMTGVPGGDFERPVPRPGRRPCLTVPS